MLEPGTNRNHAYVALTRGRSANYALIPDPTGTDNPTEQLATMIAYTSDHVSALATQAQLHHDAGLPAPPLVMDIDTPEPERPSTVTPQNEPAEPTLDERVSATQDRLNRLERTSRGRSLER